MRIVKFRDWEFVVDKEATIYAYDQKKYGSADSCICNECKNFANYRDNIYPKEIEQLFSELGIDYKKEIEIMHYCKLENEKHFYGGWFHFKGQFKGKNCKIQTSENVSHFDLTAITENFSIGFWHGSYLAFFEDKNSLIQVEFETKIPWVINKDLESK